MLSYWTNFAKTGNPNSSELPPWERMQSGEKKWQLLGPKIESQNIDRQEIYDLLEDFEFKGI